MNKQQILNGEPFAVFGLSDDLRFNPDTDKLEFWNDGKLTHESELIMETEEPAITIFARAFGIMQILTISLAVCEPKASPKTITITKEYKIPCL